LQLELGPLVGYASHKPYVEEELPAAPWFTELGRTVFETREESSPAALVAYLATASSYLTLEPAERERQLGEVHKIASRYGERFQLTRLTYAFAFRRIS
jgi:hypothetical protein